MASIIKSDNGVSSGITGIVQSADSSGQLALQTTTSGGTATTAVTIDNAQNVTLPQATAAPTNSVSLPGVLSLTGYGWNTSLGSQPIGGKISLLGPYNTVRYGQTTASLSLSTQDSDGSMTQRAQVNAFGIGLGNGTIPSSGTGIAFPATQSASSDANTLDDYEEGTWTPTATFSSVNTGVTFNNRSAIYTKVGNVVTCTINIYFSALGSASGSFSIAGLPFVSQSNGFTARSVGAVFLDRSTNGYALLDGNGATSLTLQTIPNSTGSSAAVFTQANLSNTSYLNITVSYQTN